MVYIWSVLSKCLFPRLPGGWDRATCCKILYVNWKSPFFNLCLGSSTIAHGWLIFIELMLANTFCWKATVSCPAGLSYLCAFWATGAHCQEHVLSSASACFTFAPSLRLLFVEKWLTERVLFHLTYNAPHALYTTLTLIFLEPTLITTQQLHSPCLARNSSISTKVCILLLSREGG